MQSERGGYIMYDGARYADLAVHHTWGAQAGESFEAGAMGGEGWGAVGVRLREGGPVGRGTPGDLGGVIDVRRLLERYQLERKAAYIAVSIHTSVFVFPGASSQSRRPPMRSSLAA